MPFLGGYAVPTLLVAGFFWGSTACLSIEHCSCDVQSPNDATIKQDLANAHELLQQSKGHFNPENLFLLHQSSKVQSRLANFVGPLKTSLLPGLKPCTQALTCSGIPQ